MVAKNVTFIYQMIALGLAIALASVFFFPELLGLNRGEVVTLVEAPAEEKVPTQPATIAQALAPATASRPHSYADAVAKATPAVVNIFTTTAADSSPPESPLRDPILRPFAPKKEKQNSLGSGVIVSPQGYILTNNHVIAPAGRIQVMLTDGRGFTAKAVGTDPETDIALLKIDEPNLPSLIIGSSKDLLVGDIVLAIGNPFGVGQTVTQGIISATGRSQLGLNTFEDFIQTDAAINPGSSGGALINAEGELVGINTAIFSRSGGSHGIGFAIPAKLAQNVMTQIIQHGQVKRGWLGVEGANVPTELQAKYDLPPAQGVVITSVLPGGPAAKANLEKDDILLDINGTKITGVKNALNAIARSEPGSTIQVQGLRNGQPFSAELQVSIRPIQPE